MLGFNTTAAVFKAPEWSLEEDEAQEAGKAIQRASKHYDVPVTSKQVDTMMAVYALAMLLGPRAYLTMERLKTERAAKAPRVNPRPPAQRDERPVVPQPAGVPPHGPREAQPGPGAGFPSFVADPK